MARYPTPRKGQVLELHVGDFSAPRERASPAVALLHAVGDVLNYISRRIIHVGSLVAAEGLLKGSFHGRARAARIRSLPLLF